MEIWWKDFEYLGKRMGIWNGDFLRIMEKVE
jgi:hypothetical protein